MGNFCSNCGQPVDGKSRFCVNCGNAINNVASSYQTENEFLKKEVLDNLYKKEKISLYVWIGVVCYQVLAGFALPSAWGFALWNSIACYQTYQFCQKMRQNPVGIAKHYEDALIGDIIFLILNLVLGGVIGAIGAGYDLYVRQ